MTVEVSPTIGCNLSCSYCYQDPMRLAGNFGAGFIRLDKILPRIKEANKGATMEPGFTLFGGDPLILDKVTLERLWGFGLKEYQRNGVQTNGELIDDELISLFVKYRVGVGLSVDGPWPLNAARSNEEGTKKSIDAIDKLLKSGITPGLHIILNKHNASQERLPMLVEWIKELDEKGIPEVRIHLLEIDTEAGASVALSEEENCAAFLSLAQLETRLSLEPFEDMTKLILGLRNDENSWRVGCVWNGCDAYTTPAVQKIDSKGHLSNCGRTNKDGIDFRKADVEGRERLLALYNTPHEFGGCKGCRFFFACGGQCPGEGIDGDWRNRTIHCQAYLKVFEYLESKYAVGHFELPSLSIEYRSKMEKLSMGASTGHTDVHGDTPHQDTAHIDRYVMMVPVRKKK